MLRIITMCGVVLLHYNDSKALTFVQSGTAHQFILFFLESISICAVDLFILISGYYLSGSQKRSLLKPVELIVQVVLFKEAIYLMQVILGIVDFSINGLILHAVPDNYFVILYCTLYFISPYLNLIFRHLSKSGIWTFMITIILLFSIWTTLVDLFEEIRGAEWMGLSTITRWGSMQGFNIVNFALVYCVGGFMRHELIKIPQKRTLIGAWILTVIVVYVWAQLTQNLTRLELRSAWVYHNPFVILSAMLLFTIFKDLKFQSKFINRLSAASFTCFLIHAILLPYIGIQRAVESSVWMMLVHIVISVIGVYLVSWIVYEIYTFATGWIFNRLRLWKVFQPKEIV